MSEHDPTNWYAAGGVIASLLSWLGVRQINRIDNIEKSYVSRAELNGKLEKIDAKVDRLVTHLLEKK